MIKRYSTPEMTKIWSDENKFGKWLEVELAVVRARVKIKKLSEKTYNAIKESAKFSVERIEEIDADIHHDLLAFVGNVRENLKKGLRRLFHQDITSFDTEEPALSLVFLEALNVILRELDLLIGTIKQQALVYKKLVKAERTHGQQAEPNTLGLTFLWWHDQLRRQRIFIEAAAKEMQYSKISGAVGTYSGGLSLKLEKTALGLLELKPASISGQIILRDRHAHVINALAVLAGVLENISLNIRLLGQTEVRELQEPFKDKQKGSSRMPHKKNTVLTENLCGLARLVRSYAGVAHENIATWAARDISHSSAERVIFPDAFQVSHFMLRRLNGILSKIVVNIDQIEKNLNLTHGVMFSPEVNELLMKSGLSTEEAYRVTQELAFEAIKSDNSYLKLLLESRKVPDSVKNGKIQKIFDMKNKVKNVDKIYKRSGL